MMGVLTVYLEKATNLKSKEGLGLGLLKSDPYVTLTLKNVKVEKERGYNGDGDIDQAKSNTIDNNLEPEWNQTFIFQKKIDGLADHQLYMSVKDDNGAIMKDALLGKCEINLWEIDGLEDNNNKDPIKVVKDLKPGYLYLRLQYTTVAPMLNL